MASDYDRWMFLLTVSAIPLACADDIPAEPEGSTGTTAAPPGTTSTPTPAEGTTSTTDDPPGTSTAAVDSTTVDPSSGGGSTTTGAIIPGSTDSTGIPGSSEGSSSTGELPGLCEQWATAWVACYGYYSVPYMTAYCYNLVYVYADPMCQPEIVMFISCQAFGGGPCTAMCEPQYEALETCENQVLADMLGCAMLPMIPGAGTIETQCTSLATQATDCHNAGYYINGFSQYVGYDPQYMIDFCSYGAYFTFLFPPPGMGDTCGGAYEDLLTCLSGLSCTELNETMILQNHCTTQLDALTCRCELGA